MQNEEKMLTVDDAYDATYDYLEKFYQKTNSDDVLTIVCDMLLLGDGRPKDVAIESDWSEALNKFLDQNPDIRQNFELAGKKISTKQAYQVMINFLDTYDYFKEIVAMVSKMRGVQVDAEAWNNWLKSVDKILDQTPRIRPLFFFTNTKLTVDDAYKATIDCLSKFYKKTESKDLESLLGNMRCANDGKIVDNEIWLYWNKSARKILPHDSNTSQNYETISVQESYDTMIDFLDEYSHRINSDEISDLVKRMRLSDDESHILNEFKNCWLESVNKTLNKYRTF